MKLYLLWIHMAKTEWSGDRNGRIMEELAKEYVAKHKDKLDSNSDILVEVREHGGWYLCFNSAGLCVSSANDRAAFPQEVMDWWKRFRGAEEIWLDTVRR